MASATDTALLEGFQDMFASFAKQQQTFQDSLLKLVQENNAIVSEFQPANQNQDRYMRGRPNVPRDVKKKDTKVLIDGYTEKGKKEQKKSYNDLKEALAELSPKQEKEKSGGGGLLTAAAGLVGAGVLAKIFAPEFFEKARNFLTDFLKDPKGKIKGIFEGFDIMGKIVNGVKSALDIATNLFLSLFDCDSLNFLLPKLLWKLKRSVRVSLSPISIKYFNRLLFTALKSALCLNSFFTRSK